jgi:hypothetical protein
MDWDISRLMIGAGVGVTVLAVLSELRSISRSLANLEYMAKSTREWRAQVEEGRARREEFQPLQPPDKKAEIASSSS